MYLMVKNLKWIKKIIKALRSWTCPATPLLSFSVEFNPPGKKFYPK